MNLLSENHTNRSIDKYFDGFTTRRDFINRSGIFVSENYFEIIYLEFLRSGMSVLDFINCYGSKVENAVVEVELPEKFRCVLFDDGISRCGDPNFINCDGYLNIYEVIDALDNDYMRKA